MRLTHMMSRLLILAVLPLLPTCDDGHRSNQAEVNLDTPADSDLQEGAITRWSQVAAATDGSALYAFAVATDGTADALYQSGNAWLISVKAGQVEVSDTGLTLDAKDNLAELERDAAGIVHVVWADSADAIHYVRLTNGQAETPELVSDEGRAPRLAVTDGGEVHVVYVVESSGEVIWATLDGATGWRKEVAVPRSGALGASLPDVGVVNGEPVVSYYRLVTSSERSIALASRTAGVWSTVTVAVAPLFVWNTMLEVASDGMIFVAATTSEAGTIVWTQDGASFTEVVTVGSREASSFALDGQDQPMVVHQENLYRHADQSTQTMADGCHVLVDAALGGGPIIAMGCPSGGVKLWVPDGLYPSDWVTQCTAVAESLCSIAESTCGTRCFGTACAGTSCNNSSCSSECVAGRLERLCSNATVAPAALADCAAAVTQGGCADANNEAVYGLPAACELPELPR